MKSRIFISILFSLSLATLQGCGGNYDKPDSSVKYESESASAYIYQTSENGFYNVVRIFHAGLTVERYSVNGEFVETVADIDSDFSYPYGAEIENVGDNTLYVAVSGGILLKVDLNDQLINYEFINQALPDYDDIFINEFTVDTLGNVVVSAIVRKNSGLPDEQRFKVLAKVSPEGGLLQSELFELDDGGSVDTDFMFFSSYGADQYVIYQDNLTEGSEKVFNVTLVNSDFETIRNQSFTGETIALANENGVLLRGYDVVTNDWVSDWYNWDGEHVQSLSFPVNETIDLTNKLYKILPAPEGYYFVLEENTRSDFEKSYLKACRLTSNMKLEWCRYTESGAAIFPSATSVTKEGLLVHTSMTVNAYKTFYPLDLELPVPASIATGLEGTQGSLKAGVSHKVVDPNGEIVLSKKAKPAADLGDLYKCLDGDYYCLAALEYKTGFCYSETVSFIESLGVVDLSLRCNGLDHLTMGNALNTWKL